jgi:predicted nucleic acid-binding protein
VAGANDQSPAATAKGGYAYDGDEPEKQKRAQQILEEGMQDESAVISAQVLGDLYNVVTRRIEPPMSADAGKAGSGCNK